jgi:hypothetical protein
VTLGAAAARAPSLLERVVDEDRGLLCHRMPDVALRGQADVDPGPPRLALANPHGWDSPLA